MQISNMWNACYDDPYRKLPKHGREAFFNAIKDVSFLAMFEEKLNNILVKNYNLDSWAEKIGYNKELVLEDSSKLRSFIYEKTDIYYPSDVTSETSGVSRIIYGLLDICEGHFRYETELASNLNYVKSRKHLIFMKMQAIVALSKSCESPENGKEGFVKYIKSLNSKDKEGRPKYTTIKFARFVNACFPGLPEAFVDSMNDVWKDSFGKFDASGFYFHVGRSNNHFVSAYENENTGSSSNITTTIFTKSLSYSCMQYERSDPDGWESEALESGIHCVSAYATDEEETKGRRFFEIMYLTNSEDPYDVDCTIYGRVIFSRRLDNGWPEWGPVYCVGNAYKKLFVNKMRDFVDDKEYKRYFDNFISKYDDPDCCNFAYIWHGALMKAYDVTGYSLKKSKFLSNSKKQIGTSIIAPYIDVGDKCVHVEFLPDNPNVFMSVIGSNNDFESDPRYSEEENAIEIEEGVFAKRNNMINHQGCNFLNAVSLHIECPCCKKKTSNDRFNTISVFTEKGKPSEEMTVCNECYHEKFIYNSLKRIYYMRTDDLIIRKHYVGKFPSGHTYLTHVSNCISEGKLNDLVMTAYRNLTNQSTVIEDIDFDGEDVHEGYVIVDDYYDGKKMHENVIAKDDDVIEINGVKYATMDTRIAYDMQKKALVIREDKEVDFIRIENAGRNFDFRVTTESYMKLIDYLNKAGMYYREEERCVKHDIYESKYGNILITNMNLHEIYTFMDFHRKPVTSSRELEETVNLLNNCCGTSKVIFYVKKGNEFFLEGSFVSYYYDRNNFISLTGFQDKGEVFYCNSFNSNAYTIMEGVELIPFMSALEAKLYVEQRNLKTASLKEMKSFVLNRYGIENNLHGNYFSKKARIVRKSTNEVTSSNTDLFIEDSIAYM